MSPYRLVLDFDGVLWDSVGECYVTAGHAYLEQFGVQPVECEQAFRSGRWMARVGGDFLVLLELAMAEPERDFSEFPRSEFERLKAALAEDATRFEERFYARRAWHRDNDPEGWASLQHPYPLFMAEMPFLKDAFGPPAIATTKDAASVKALLAPYRLDYPVVGREYSTDKRLQVRRLATEWGTTPERLLFIDDLLDNLAPVGFLGCKVALAGWGYNTPAERRRAEASGIPVLQPGRVLEGLQCLG